MRKIALILSLSAAIISCNQQNQDAYAACTELDKIDTKMLELIEQIKTAHADNKKFTKAIDMEQVYWIQYRDRRIRSMYPKSWDLHYRKVYGREAFNSCKCQEIVRLSNIRMQDLNMYLEGSPEEQQDCPSIINE